MKKRFHCADFPKATRKLALLYFSAIQFKQLLDLDHLSHILDKNALLCPTENILQVLSGNTAKCEGSARVEQSFYREKLNKFWTNEHETGKTGTDFMNLSQFDKVNILSKF